MSTQTLTTKDTARALEAQSLRLERTKVNSNTIKIAVRMILEAIGEDTSRPDLQETPARVARFWEEWIGYDPGNTHTTFLSEHVSNQLVVVSGMRIWSICAHHLLPFYTDVSCGYIADGKVLGLSKFARIAHQFGHALQSQERLATQIADEIERITKTSDVAVLCSGGMHTCMTMRGIRTEGQMNNAVMRGVFLLDARSRNEFYNLTRR